MGLKLEQELLGPALYTGITREHFKSSGTFASCSDLFINTQIYGINSDLEVFINLVEIPSNVLFFFGFK